MPSQEEKERELGTERYFLDHINTRINLYPSLHKFDFVIIKTVKHKSVARRGRRVKQKYKEENRLKKYMQMALEDSVFREDLLAFNEQKLAQLSGMSTVKRMWFMKRGFLPVVGKLLKLVL